MAHAAIDALDAGIGGLTFGRFWRDDRKVVRRIVARLEIAMRAAPFLEERRHVDREILYNRQVA